MGHNFSGKGSGRLNRKYFSNLNKRNFDDLIDRTVCRRSKTGVQRGTIEEAVYMQKPSIPDYEAGTIYIMPYRRKVLNNLFNVATDEENAVVWIRKVRMHDRVYGPGQFTRAMKIGKGFDGQNIEDSDVWIE